MSFLLDTNICSAYLKGNSAVFHRFVQHGGRLFISVISVGELWTWATRHGAPVSRANGLGRLWRDVQILDIDYSIAKRFGELRGEKMDKGLSTPELDLLIAATALEHQLTLVTHNIADFSGLNLSMQDWLSV